MQLSAHFSTEELECPCCKRYIPNVYLLALLENIRTHFDKPVHINSGTRCPKHNKAVGGEPGSQHMKGRAADITVEAVSPGAVWAYVDSVNEGGVGRYDAFTHVDVRGSKARWDNRTNKDS